MADDLEERKEETWRMGEVRSTGAGSETDDTDDRTTVDRDTADPSDTEDASDTPGSSDTTDARERADVGDTEDTDESSDGETAPVTAEGETVRRMANDAEAKGFAVRDLHNVNVYLYEDIYREMVVTFKQLDSEYFHEHGDELTKNKEFFNAVFRAGLQSSELREELELE